MVITDRFVFVHMPKTGGTFVTHVLKQLHGVDAPIQPKYRSGLFRNLLKRSPSASRYGPLLNVEPKHGTCSQIPAPYRTKPILSAVRNPYDWYVSQYAFEWWKKTFLYHPEKHPTPDGSAIESALPEFERAHPHFPDVSFDEFMDLCELAAAPLNSGTCRPALGLYTHSFLRYYYRNVESVVSRLDPQQPRSARIEADRFNVRFVRTDWLKQDLASYLGSVGYRAEYLAFISELGRILPMGRGRTEEQTWEKYYTPRLKELVRNRDWPLFELFPEFDG